MTQGLGHVPFQLARGTRLNGIYEVETLIASGGMGDVYKGHAIETGDVVAIKVMRQELAENESALALFRKEASALHNLNHDAIVRYFVFSIEPVLRRPYLAMELVEGEALSDMLKRGPLPFDAVCELTQRMATGLQVAHERGIVHRDVSPDNIIVPMYDVSRAKIIDFGIARSTRPDNTGTVIGTGFAGKFSYVSPEQLGMFGGDVTAKSDIYSLGLVLAEVLMGQPIDMGQSHFDSIERRRNVPDLRKVDARIRPLLERMLQPDPWDRPDSMADVAAAAPKVVRPRKQSVPPAAIAKPAAKPATKPLIKPATKPGAAKVGVRSSSTSESDKGRRLALIVSGALLLIGGGLGGAYFALAPDVATLPPTPVLAATDTPGAGPATEPARPPVNRPTPAVKPTVSRPADKTPPAEPATVATKEARIAPTPPPKISAPQTVTRTEQIARYISQYNGGDCFFVLPLALNDAKPRLEGYGVSVAPFEAFDSAFTRANNVEADIGVREVTPAQCAALTFLNRMRAGAAAAPQLEVGVTALRGGETLTGTIDNIGTKQLAFLLVADTGTVHNLTSLLRPEGDRRRFSIPMARSGTPGSQPQLLVVLTSAQPLESLRPGQTMSAAQFFPPLMAEASGPGHSVGTTARYFRLER